jgi:actin-like ATPase involved in cell morphogenesis
MGIFNWFTQEIAIDLGTANTLIIHNDKVVVDEPSIVAFDRASNTSLLPLVNRLCKWRVKPTKTL